MTPHLQVGPFPTGQDVGDRPSGWVGWQDTDPGPQTTNQVSFSPPCCPVRCQVPLPPLRCLESHVFSTFPSPSWGGLRQPHTPTPHHSPASPGGRRLTPSLLLPADGPRSPALTQGHVVPRSSHPRRVTGAQDWPGDRDWPDVGTSKGWAALS